MSSRRLILGLVAAAGLSGLLGGCVYYNGMYNANRLARSARKAEREGRTFEANGLWGQVATKAESVMVRHPTSKYAQDAGLLRGIALSRMGQCEQALGPLSRLTTATSNSDLIEDALLATGRCQLALGNYTAGTAAFAQLLESKNAERRREALFHQARLLRQAGQYPGALKALEGQHDLRAEHERVLALAGSGRIKEAMGLADSLMAHGDTLHRTWDTLVVALADAHPAAASDLIDRVLRLPNRPPQTEGRMLLDDGFRLLDINPPRAKQRFRQAIKVGGLSEAAGRASLELVKLDLKRVTRPQELQTIADTLKWLARFELVSQETARLSATVEDVMRVATLVTPDSALGDLRLFLAAEAARDELESARLAELLFRQVPEQWPQSPYAAKAVLAAQQLNPAWADTARFLLEFQYFDSPYLATVRGDATPEYRQLEDSLGAFAAALAVRRAPPPVRRAPRPGVYPRRRPEPVSGGSNVPEPQ